MNDRYTDIWSELRDNMSNEMIGLLSFLIGSYLMISLVSAPDGTVPFLARDAGWAIAPWFALTLIVLGGVLMLQRWAGYWSVEAIIGAQLLLLSLMTTSYLSQNYAVDWVPHFDGSQGGLVGWSFGNLLLSGFGRMPALFLMLSVGIIGLIALFRYTPLIYVAGNGYALWPRVNATFSQLWHQGRAQIATMTQRRNDYVYDYDGTDHWGDDNLSLIHI